MSVPTSLSFLPVGGLPEIRPGDDLAQVLEPLLGRDGNPQLRDGDVVIVVQKVISKAEDRYVALEAVTPGPQALELAARCAKDPRLVELVLRESTDVVRARPGVLIVRHRLGFVVANAAIDQSNLPAGDERALLLPEDPDASAARLRAALEARYGVRLAVLISDSFGRPWRLGVCGVCIGCDGLRPLLDLRGAPDRSGRAMQVTQIAVADELCATATLVCGEGAEGIPVVIVRGLPGDHFADGQGATGLVRALAEDLFQ